MKKKNDDSQSEKSEREKILESLLGSEDDFGDEECSEQYLIAAGIDPFTLATEFKEHLQEKARQQQAEEGLVSESVNSALKSLRTHIKSSDPMNVEPGVHINQLLGGLLAESSSTAGFAYAFHNRTDEEMPDEDQQTLDALEAELNGDDKVPT